MNSLIGIVAGEGVIEDDYVQAAGGADKVIASTAPVLPLTDLVARSLLPHLVRVIEALGAAAVSLQGKISVHG